jgi:hypothetical protein
MMKVLSLLVALGAVGCSGNSPAAPTPPAVPLCQSAQTATVYFQNRSTTKLTYDILWDGSRLTTVAPGADSGTFTVSANVAHSLRFQVTNTGILACSASAPILATCASTFYGCGG